MSDSYAESYAFSEVMRAINQLPHAAVLRIMEHAVAWSAARDEANRVTEAQDQNLVAASGGMATCVALPAHLQNLSSGGGAGFSTMRVPGAGS